MALKFGDLTIILFIQELQKQDVPALLDQYKGLYNVNLAQDRHNECKNMLQRSQTGFYFVACSKDQKDGKDKEVQSDDNTKLEQLAQMI